MRLTHVQIRNFRSVEDSEKFAVDQLTCLVGKNEAGKTAILQALQSLNPLGISQTQFDVTKEYPRRFVTRFGERHRENPSDVVNTWWKLDAQSQQALQDEFGENAITGDEIRITRYYNDKVTTWFMNVDEAQAISNLIDQARFSAAERKGIGHTKTAATLLAALNNVPEKTQKHTALLNQLNGFRDKSLIKRAIDVISPNLPKFFYVSHYDRMSGQISVDKLMKDNQEGNLSVEDSIFLDFLKLAGTSLEELQAATRYEELKAKCEAASNEITEQIFRYWTQNESLEVNLDFSQGQPKDPVPFNSGTVIRARVWNSLHRASVPFSERSAGFVWFFSFLVQFAAMRDQARGAIILLDEPGLTLHGKAQADLLRYIEEELLPHHQVIFSTHSPFMVPADRFESVRIVEDVVDKSHPGRPAVKGTRVSSDVLVTDRDTLFPLQGALGYDLVQSLFIGKNTLLVEGPADILYLQVCSDALKRRGRSGLDTKWVVCPSGGIDKIRPFVSLFGGNKLNVAVLSDFSAKDRKKIEELRRSAILKTGNMFTVADFVDKPEADMEDFFEPVLFANILNATYNLPKPNRLSAETLIAADSTTPRLVKKAEAAFRVMPSTVAEFDHFAPAAWLIRNPSLLDATDEGAEATLERFEKLFATLNLCLSD